MDTEETAKIMKLIQSQYRSYYRDPNEIKFALGVMEKLFADWDYSLIEKGLFRFMQTDSKGFPPVAGQIITLAAEIRKSEWEQNKREQDALPEPAAERIPCPDDIREKMENLCKL